MAVVVIGAAAIGGICGIGGKKNPAAFGGGLSSGVMFGGIPEKIEYSRKYLIKSNERTFVILYLVQVEPFHSWVVVEALAYSMDHLELQMNTKRLSISCGFTITND